MKKSLGRSTALVLASLGVLAVPTPASSQDYEALRECFRNCHEAYVVMTQQPAFYEMCRQNCVDWYGGGGMAEMPAPVAVTRYD